MKDFIGSKQFYSSLGFFILCDEEKAELPNLQKICMGHLCYYDFITRYIYPSKILVKNYN